MASLSESSISTSSLLRSRSSIALVASLAAACSIYLLYSYQSAAEDQEEGVQVEVDQASGELHRSNAVRRRRRSREEERSIERGVWVPVGPIDADDDETENPPGDEDEIEAQKSVLLDELVWAITKNRAKTDGRIHRSITCDVCGNCPIKGIRYRCANCPDFDLCESCESRDMHHPTHVFYKIKVPAPWAGKIPTPVWYPGKPHMLPEELPLSIKKRVSQLAGSGPNGSSLSEDKIGGLYAQFRNVANKRWDQDPYELWWALDKHAFRECIVPQITPRDKLSVNLIYDRIFVFYDTNKDGLIGFEEFVLGTHYIHNRGDEEWKKRLFKGFDLDEDGFISRSDMLLVFRAYYELTGENLTNHLFARRIGEDPDQVREGPDPHEFVQSGRALASYYPRFPAHIPQFPHNVHAGEEKAVNENGDLVPSNLEMPPVLDRIGQESQMMCDNLIVTDAWISSFEELEAEWVRLVNGLPMKYTKMSEVMCKLSKRLYGKELFLYEGKIWVKWRVVPSESGIKPPITVALHVPPSALPQQLKEYVQNHKATELVEGKLRLIVEKAVEHAENYLQILKTENEPWAQETHRKRQRWLPSSTLKPITTASSSLSNGSHAVDEPKDDQAATESSANTSVSTSVDGNQLGLTSSKSKDRNNIGAGSRRSGLPAYGNAATQTMFDVVQKALNDMLDPLFALAEEEVTQAEELEDKIEEFDYYIKWYDRSKEMTLANKKEAWDQLAQRDLSEVDLRGHLDFIANSTIVVTLAALDQKKNGKTALEDDKGFQRMIKIIEEHDQVELSRDQLRALLHAFERHVNIVVQKYPQILGFSEDAENNGSPPETAALSEERPKAAEIPTEPQDQGVEEPKSADGDSSDSKRESMDGLLPMFSLGASFIDLVWYDPPSELPPPDTPNFFDLAPLSLGVLSHLKKVKDTAQKRGGGGKLDFNEFREKISTTTDSEGEIIRHWTDRSWIGSWLEVVTF